MSILTRSLHHSRSFSLSSSAFLFQPFSLYNSLLSRSFASKSSSPSPSSSSNEVPIRSRRIRAEPVPLPALDLPPIDPNHPVLQHLGIKDYNPRHRLILRKGGVGPVRPHSGGKKSVAEVRAQLQELAKPTYSTVHAIKLCKACAIATFDESITIALRLNLDPRKPNQSVRAVALLPHGTGVTVRVAVFAKGDKAIEAKNAGADIIGDQDLADKILSGTIEFDRCIATPDLMPLVGRVARVLGPRGLMPNPKLGTVTLDLANAIKVAKAGQVEFKTDKTGTVHAPVGKASFSNQALLENIESLVKSCVAAKPSGARGNYMKSAALASCQGPGIPLDIKQIPFKGLQTAYIAPAALNNTTTAATTTTTTTPTIAKTTA